MLTCTDPILAGRSDSLDFGILQGRYVVHSWPNAELRLFVNDSGCFIRPGQVLDFGKGARVAAESLPLLADVHCVIESLDGGKREKALSIESGRRPTWQYQLLCRTHRVPNQEATSLTGGNGVVARVDGLASLRIAVTADPGAGSYLQLAERCSGGGVNYLFPQLSTATALADLRVVLLYTTARIMSGNLYDLIAYQSSGHNIDYSIDLGAGEV